MRHRERCANGRKAENQLARASVAALRNAFAFDVKQGYQKFYNGTSSPDECARAARPRDCGRAADATPAPDDRRSFGGGLHNASPTFR
ncbi:hypothetical protein EVAR_55897_1 [Eumeta japonica]|uniref:Uncharacterized protein n=1 Tax=Eumeta variegata TaxID=151549 RepID=A0A4C1YKP7_EUMVA|nr:hypothetical protein EVAR_55897_1 [Eumeta japonica]